MQWLFYSTNVVLVAACSVLIVTRPDTAGHQLTSRALDKCTRTKVRQEFNMFKEESRTSRAGMASHNASNKQVFTVVPTNVQKAGFGN